MTTQTMTGSSDVKPSKALNIALWVAQGLLGTAFIFAGSLKVSQPVAELALKMPWVTHFSEGMVRFIGTSELLGGVGLLLPSITRIKPVLTSIAALGLVTVMVLASAFHISQGEFNVLPINFTMGALASFIAWGRFKKAPIAPRS